MQKYTAKNYNHLQNIGQISNEAMQMHFKLYEGYVNNVNLLLERCNFLKEKLKLSSCEPCEVVEYNEIHRRFGWEFNGMRNHELFFDSLQATEVNFAQQSFSENFPLFSEKISENFGDFESWKNDFTSQCKIRGMGWVMLVQDNVTGKLINTFVNEHDAGMLSDVTVIFLVDMFEHAYVKDFGTNRLPYIESIFSHINWEIIEKRLAK